MAITSCEYIIYMHNIIVMSLLLKVSVIFCFRYYAKFTCGYCCRVEKLTRGGCLRNQNVSWISFILYSIIILLFEIRKASRKLDFSTPVSLHRYHDAIGVFL